MLELFKMLALSKMKSDDADSIPDELRFTGIDEEEEEKKVFFAAFREARYLGVLELPYSLYQSCVITGEPIWDYPVTECGAVDQQWVLERMEEERKHAAEEEANGCDCGECSGCGEEHHHH